MKIHGFFVSENYGMNSFDDLILENLSICEDAGTFSGIRTRIYYAPEYFFHGIVLPDSQDFAASLTIPVGDIEMKEGKAWFYFDCLIDENEMKVLTSGSGLRKKLKSQLNLFLLGFVPKVLGFIHTLGNVPMVFAVDDHNGRTWILGNRRNQAIIEKAEGGTGKTYTDNAGVSASISANTPIYLYAGSIHEFHLLAGDFNTDFNKDFLI